MERFIYEFSEESSFIDKSRIYPPYNSDAIPIVDKHRSYKVEDGDSGWNYIESSMRMSTHGWYGDFGRYVFQSALGYFEDVDLENCFHYAMQFIRDELGYTKEYIYENDRSSWSRNVNFDRNHVGKTERIGKKYQWIALYNILARISDRHKVKDYMYAEDYETYKGSWNPYVRDFDPTLNSHFLKNPDIPVLESHVDFEYKLDSKVESISSRVWVTQEENFFSQNSKFLCHNDNKKNEWVFLISYAKTEIGHYESILHDMWSWTLSYFVSKKTWPKIKKAVMNMDLRNGIQGSNYVLFNREYFWSSGVDDTLMNHASKYGRGGNIMKNLIPTKVSFKWEEEYDASQDESVSFEMPMRILVEEMELCQHKYDGSFYNKANELVAFDTQLSNQKNIYNRGLAIRKNILLEFLEKTDMTIFWFSFGEKQAFRKKDGGQVWSEWEGFYELDKPGFPWWKLPLILSKLFY